MKPQVLISTTSAPSGSATLTNDEPNPPSIHSVSTRFFGQPRLIVCGMHLFHWFLQFQGNVRLGPEINVFPHDGAKPGQRLGIDPAMPPKFAA